MIIKQDYHILNLKQKMSYSCNQTDSINSQTLILYPRNQTAIKLVPNKDRVVHH